MNINQFKFEKKKINYIFSNKIFTEDIRKLNEGVNHLSNYIIFKNGKNFKVYDRICNHNGGRLITKTNKEIVCPLHGWRFDPISGKYLNNNCKKQQLPFEIIKNLLHIKVSNKLPEFIQWNVQKRTEISFINHACLYVETDDLKFATDPWIIGPAFSRGWWLKKNSPRNSFEKLNECDFIFISHNHPDHLHPLSLEKINKNKLIITPNFKSDSTSKYLRSLGFRNIYALEFGYQYYAKKINFNLALLKSGDFRDDSGIHFSNGNFNSIFSVDSNSLNFYELPKEISLLASSFAGGATGYPLCFEKFTNEKKRVISNRNLNSIRIANKKMISITKTKYFLPYAGFFTESANRDKFIKKNNKKNIINDYQDMCQKNNTTLLNVDVKQKFSFFGKDLKYSNNFNKNEIILDKNMDYYIKEAKKKYAIIDKKEIKNYFLKSKFKDQITLKITLTDDAFKIYYISFVVNFSSQKPELTFLKQKSNVSLRDLQKQYSGNVIELKIRKESFLELIKEKLPWEDLLIGFQTRITRLPDVYNSNFWYFFTNIYVKDYAKRSTESCSGCEVLEQNLDQAI